MRLARRGSRDSCVYQRSAPSAFLREEITKRKLRKGNDDREIANRENFRSFAMRDPQTLRRCVARSAALNRPRDGGGGEPLKVGVASEPWWRGRSDSPASSPRGAFSWKGCRRRFRPSRKYGRHIWGYETNRGASLLTLRATDSNLSVSCKQQSAHPCANRGPSPPPYLPSPVRTDTRIPLGRVPSGRSLR